MSVVKGWPRDVLQNAGSSGAVHRRLHPGAWFGMNDVSSAKASFAAPGDHLRRKNNWLMCWLYLGTFGSFIGYSAGMPLLIKSQFPGKSHPSRVSGALVRRDHASGGGWIADKLAARG